MRLTSVLAAVIVTACIAGCDDGPVIKDNPLKAIAAVKWQRMEYEQQCRRGYWDACAKAHKLRLMEEKLYEDIHSRRTR